MNRRPRPAVRRGFTLIELLTVIAIIAILVALLFPVFGGMAHNARMGQSASNIKSIIQALHMYKDDHGVFPDALYGVSYDGGPLEPRLFPNYVKDKSIFVDPFLPNELKNDSSLVQPTNPMTGAAAIDAYGRTLSFPRFDSYDMQVKPRSKFGSFYLNYSRKWTVGAAGIADDNRQLVYKNPPDNTVVVVDLLPADADAAGNVGKGRMAVVGFLGGQVQQIPAEKVAQWPGPDGLYPWQVAPKP